MERENKPSEEDNLIESAIASLQRLLPSSWKVTRSTTTYNSADRARRRPDAAIDIESPGMRMTIITEARTALAPRDAERMFSGTSLVRSLRAVAPNLPILVVAGFLSPRTREILEREEINYVDLTGNAYLRVDSPPVIYVRTEGAKRDTQRAAPGEVKLRGPRAGRVLRLLLDVRPPYGVRDVADRTGVALSYVSRLLESLDRETLVVRGSRGRIESVDVPGLLRRWAASYDLFKSNKATNYYAQRGPTGAQVLLREQQPRRVAITGSFAAARFSSVAAPTLLAIYVADQAGLARDLDLLRTADRPNVVLLEPYDPVVFDRMEEEVGLRYVAPSQAAVDCLAGNGRMPAEGEALMNWMDANENSWRIPSIGAVPSALR